MNPSRHIIYIGCNYHVAELLFSLSNLVVEAANLEPDGINCQVEVGSRDRLKSIERILKRENITYYTVEQ